LWESSQRLGGQLREKKTRSSNKLVKVTDLASANTLPAVQKRQDEGNQLGRFVTLRAANAGEVFRGVAFAPKDHGAADNQE